MKVINRTSHLIIAGRVMFVPNIPVECDFDDMRKKYPKLKQDELQGNIQVISEEAAQYAEQELEQKTIKELKEYAEKNGISLDGAKSKAEILAILQEKA